MGPFGRVGTPAHSGAAGDASAGDALWIDASPRRAIAIENYRVSARFVQ
jgi:hypothetical protein